MRGGEEMKTDLLSRLAQENPEHKPNDIDEALRRGYSIRQIMKAMNPAMSKTEPRQGKIWYSGRRGIFEVPYTYETLTILCQLLFDE